jgi:hypothetical protein
MTEAGDNSITHAKNVNSTLTQNRVKTKSQTPGNLKKKIIIKRRPASPAPKKNFLTKPVNKISEINIRLVNGEPITTGDKI